MQIITLILLAFTLFPSIAYPATYWVSSDGSSTWNEAGCQSESDPGAGKYCSLDVANQNVAAGDTVYLKGGIYTLSGGNTHDYGVSPSVTGTSEAKITYTAAAGETPILNTSGFAYYGIYLSGKDYIVVDGITFNNITTFASISDSNYNEVKNCTFGPSTGDGSMAAGMFSLSGGSTHNWVHDNTFKHGVGADPCGEGTDLIRIGSGYAIGSVDGGNNYNTIEDNTLYHAAHTVIDNFGMYNVIRNNVSHNEPWITTCTAGQTGKEIVYDNSTSSVAVGTGNKTFTVSSGKTYATGSPVGAVRTSDHAVAMQGVVSSYSATTLVINVLSVSGSGTYEDWTITKSNFPEYETASYDGKFGHRNFQLSDDYGRTGTYVLVEGNRLGHASNNPGNGGPMNLDCAAPRNIVRYNAIFNGMSSGIYFKYASSDLTSKILSSSSVEVGEGSKTFTIASGLHITDGQTVRIWNTADNTIAMTGMVTSYGEETGELVVNVTATNGSGTLDAWQIFWNGASGGVNNRIFHNTVYHNGNGYDWRVYGNENVAYGGQGVSQVNSAGTGSTANIIKNNIIYDNKEGVVCSFDLYTGDSSTEQCSAQAWDTVSNNFTGDPSFVNPSLSDATSTTLPDLSLQSSSPAIDGGTFLTLANGVGDNNATIHVDDALYFQDGTWGSSLSNIQADWIAIGTVTNVVQISSIDYQTNTITLAEAKTWADDAPIWLYKKSDGEVVLYGSAPDYGAHEYQDSTPTTSTSHASGSFNLR